MDVTFFTYREVSGVRGQANLRNGSRLGNKPLISRHIAAENACPDARNLTPDAMIFEQSTRKRLHSNLLRSVPNAEISRWHASESHALVLFLHKTKEE